VPETAGEQTGTPHNALARGLAAAPAGVRLRDNETEIGAAQ